MGNSENLILGKWEIEIIKNSEGSSKEGKKILVFFEDNTLLSRSKSGTEIKGTWEMKKNPLTLFLHKESVRNWQSYEIIKLNQNELILEDTFQNTIHCKKSK